MHRLARFAMRARVSRRVCQGVASAEPLVPGVPHDVSYSTSWTLRCSLNVDASSSIERVSRLLLLLLLLFLLLLLLLLVLTIRTLRCLSLKIGASSSIECMYVC